MRTESSERGHEGDSCPHCQEADTSRIVDRRWQSEQRYQSVLFEREARPGEKTKSADVKLIHLGVILTMYSIFDDFGHLSARP